MNFWDQSAALDAHRRMSSPPAKEATTKRKKLATQSRRLMTHLCRDCGATDPTLFLPERKNLCRQCKHKQQNQSRTTARRSMKASAAAIVSRGRKK